MIHVKLKLSLGSVGHKQLKEYKDWLDSRQVKYSMVYSPLWDTAPSAIQMREEDALIFKIVFSL